MDFIHDYRLLHIEEISDETKNLLGNIQMQLDDSIKIIMPLLSNYSSDYICYVQKIDQSEYIASYLHDDAILAPMYKSIESFFKSLNDCYKQKAYYLDEIKEIIVLLSLISAGREMVESKTGLLQQELWLMLILKQTS